MQMFNDDDEFVINDPNKTKTIVISDLHVDSWYAAPCQFKKNGDVFSKEQIFEQFCEYLKSCAARLVINGDLLDVPNFHGGRFYNSNSPHKPIIDKIMNLIESGIDVVLLAGNHDFAFWAFHGSTLPLGKFRYPSTNKENQFLLRFEPKPSADGQAQSPIVYYLEHGHAHDPLIDAYRFNIFHSLGREDDPSDKNKYKEFLGKVGERGKFRGNDESSYLPPLIVNNLQSLQGSSIRDFSIKPKIGPIRILRYLFSREWFSVLKYLMFRIRYFNLKALESYRKHAVTVFDDVTKELSKESSKYDVRGLIFGHTHKKDSMKFNHNGKEVLYLNSGDWNEPLFIEDLDTHNANYIVFDRYGTPEELKDGDGIYVRDYIEEQGYEYMEVTNEDKKLTEERILTHAS